eukprot:g28.t1
MPLHLVDTLGIPPLEICSEHSDNAVCEIERAEVTLWLRRLQMESYSVAFYLAGYTTLAKVAQIEGKDLNRLGVRSAHASKIIIPAIKDLRFPMGILWERRKNMPVIGATLKESDLTTTTHGATIIHVVYENQRFIRDKGWGSSQGWHLGKGDPPHWMNPDGTKAENCPSDFFRGPIPGKSDGWIWSGVWMLENPRTSQSGLFGENQKYLDKTDYRKDLSDKDGGWYYGLSFKTIRNSSGDGAWSRHTGLTLVRQRRWSRVAKLDRRKRIALRAKERARTSAPSRSPLHGKSAVAMVLGEKTKMTYTDNYGADAAMEIIKAAESYMKENEALVMDGDESSLLAKNMIESHLSKLSHNQFSVLKEADKALERAQNRNELSIQYRGRQPESKELNFRKLHCDSMQNVFVQLPNSAKELKKIQSSRKAHSDSMRKVLNNLPNREDGLRNLQSSRKLHMDSMRKVFNDLPNREDGFRNLQSSRKLHMDLMRKVLNNLPNSQCNRKKHEKNFASALSTISNSQSNESKYSKEMNKYLQSAEQHYRYGKSIQRRTTMHVLQKKQKRGEKALEILKKENKAQEAALTTLQREHEALKKIQRERELEKAQLRRAHEIALNALSERHQKEMNKMKQAMGTNVEKTIKDIAERHQNQLIYAKEEALCLQAEQNETQVMFVEEEEAHEKALREVGAKHRNEMEIRIEKLLNEHNTELNEMARKHEEWKHKKRLKMSLDKLSDRVRQRNIQRKYEKLHHESMEKILNNLPNSQLNREKHRRRFVNSLSKLPYEFRELNTRKRHKKLHNKSMKKVLNNLPDKVRERNRSRKRESAYKRKMEKLQSDLLKAEGEEGNRRKRNFSSDKERNFPVSESSQPPKLEQFNDLNQKAVAKLRGFPSEVIEIVKFENPGCWEKWSGRRKLKIVKQEVKERENNTLDPMNVKARKKLRGFNRELIEKVIEANFSEWPKWSWRRRLKVVKRYQKKK